MCKYFDSATWSVCSRKFAVSRHEHTVESLSDRYIAGVIRYGSLEPDTPASTASDPSQNLFQSRRASEACQF